MVLSRLPWKQGVGTIRLHLHEPVRRPVLLQRAHPSRRQLRLWRIRPERPFLVVGEPMVGRLGPPPGLHQLGRSRELRHRVLGKRHVCDRGHRGQRLHVRVCYVDAECWKHRDGDGDGKLDEFACHDWHRQSDCDWHIFDAAYGYFDEWCRTCEVAVRWYVPLEYHLCGSYLDKHSYIGQFQAIFKYYLMFKLFLVFF